MPAAGSSEKDAERAVGFHATCAPTYFSLLRAGRREGEGERRQQRPTRTVGLALAMRQLRPAAAGSLQSLPPSLLGCLRLEEELPEAAGTAAAVGRCCGERGPSDAAGGFDVVFGSHDGGIRQICLRSIIALHISRDAPWFGARSSGSLGPSVLLALMCTVYVCCDQLFYSYTTSISIMNYIYDM